jgi:hypothetical protein
MQSNAKTVEEYLTALPTDRRAALEAVRATIRRNLPAGYEEGMQYGMIGYFVPHSVYPPGYHCDPSQPLPFASLASQKNHMAIYLMCVYGDPAHREWFRAAWEKTGRKLDMGKSCVRFTKIEDVALAVIGQSIKRVPVRKLIAFYESVAPATKKRPTRTRAAKKRSSAPASARKRSTKTPPIAKSSSTSQRSARRRPAAKRA